MSWWGSLEVTQLLFLVNLTILKVSLILLSLSSHVFTVVMLPSSGVSAVSHLMSVMQDIVLYLSYMPSLDCYSSMCNLSEAQNISPYTITSRFPRDWGSCKIQEARLLVLRDQYKRSLPMTILWHSIRTIQLQTSMETIGKPLAAVETNALALQVLRALGRAYVCVWSGNTSKLLVFALRVPSLCDSVRFFRSRSSTLDHGETSSEPHVELRRFPA